MTAVRIPAPQGQSAPLAARLSVRLVTADGKPVLAFKGFDLLGDYADLALDQDLTLELTPTAALALPDGAATYYQFILRTPGRVERYQVQVPAAPPAVELADLVAATAIPPGEILAEILAPYLIARDAALAAADAADADAQATAADRVQTGLDAQATAADVQATAADRVQTGLDAQATAADRVQTGVDAQATAADRVQTGQDAQATAADREQTGLDVQATGADRVQTGLDVQATAGDRVQTGLDVQATGADRVQTGLDAQATAADRVQTGLDVHATAADRVQTGLDVQSTAALLDAFDDRYLGAKAVEPTLDNDGDPLPDGALYFNTALDEMRVYGAGAWRAAYLPTTDWQPLILPAASLTVDTAITAGNLALTGGAPALASGVVVTVAPSACWLILGDDPAGLEYDPVAGAWNRVDLRAPLTLAGLADAAAPYPHDRELLEYDGARARWVNRPARTIATRLRPDTLTQDLEIPADTWVLTVTGEAVPRGRALSLAPGASLAVAGPGQTLLQYDAASDSFASVAGVTGAAVGTLGAQTLRDKTLVAPVLERPVLTGPAISGGSLELSGAVLDQPVLTEVAVTGGTMSGVAFAFPAALIHEAAISGTQTIPPGCQALSLMPLDLPSGAVVAVGAGSRWSFLWRPTTDASAAFG